MAVALSESVPAVARSTSCCAVSCGAARLREQRVDFLVRQDAVHAVAAEQVAIVQVRGFLEVIDAQAVLRTDRARERVRRARRTQRVVGREQGQHVVAQAVDARVTNMDQMGTTSAQNQCTQSAGHAVQIGIRAPERVNPPIDRVRRARADARNADGRRLPETTVYEAAHGQFSSHTAAFGASHAI